MDGVEVLASVDMTDLGGGVYYRTTADAIY